MYKKITGSLYVVASLFILISQLGLSTVFAEQLTSHQNVQSVQISTDMAEYHIGDPIKVLVTGPKKEMDAWKLKLSNDLIIEKSTRLDDTHQEFKIKGRKAGEYTLSGTTLTGQVVKTKLIINAFHSENQVQPRGSERIEATGDDPGIEIHSPDTIVSSQNVELDVSLQGSSGKLNEDGIIKVTIPKQTVKNASDLSNTANYSIAKPFYLGNPIVTQNENGDYVVTIGYKAADINQTEAFAATVKIHYQTPINTNSHEKVEYVADMTQGMQKSSDTDESELVPRQTKHGVFEKWSPNRRQIIEGISSAIMDTTDSTRNIFAICLNYTHENLHGVKVEDTLPTGTSMTDSRPYQNATGDGSIIKHLRILKVTSWDEDNEANGWEYVTDQFADKIQLTAQGFTVDFGDLNPDESYELVYGVSINELFDGNKINNAVLTSKEHQKNAKEYISILDDHFQKYSLEKKVNKTTLAASTDKLTYTLNLKTKSGKLPVDTEVTDPLTQDFSDATNFEYDPSVVSKPIYDKETNTISYHLIKELDNKSNTVVKFDAKLKNNSENLQPGYVIKNKASFNFEGTDIYSNTSTTTLASSLILTKKDETSGEKLKGAKFEFKNSENQVVATEITDSNGQIKIGTLEKGDYTVTEIEAPSGYIIDSTPVHFTVKEGMTDTINLVRTNKLQTGSVSLTKTDEQTGKVLAGAIFELEKQDGTVLQKDLKTNEKGQLLVANLQPGDYQFVETAAPAGYEKDPAPVTFTIKKGQNAVVQVKKTNTQKDYALRIIKKDAQTKATLAGAKFTLYDANKKVIKENIVTDSDGEVSVEHLKPGAYLLKEIAAPNGYDIEQKEISFTVKADTKLITLTVYNHKHVIPNKPSKDKTLPQTNEKKTIIWSSIGIASISVVVLVWFKRKK